MNRRSSPVWNFFSIANATTYTAKCNLCKSIMSYKTSVSNLKKHLLRKHPTVEIFRKEANKNTDADDRLNAQDIDDDGQQNTSKDSDIRVCV